MGAKNSDFNSKHKKLIKRFLSRLPFTLNSHQHI